MKESMSAWMDSEATDQESKSLGRTLGDAEQREAWQTYHLIGDALRGDLDCNVAGRVSRALVDEPTVLAPRVIIGEQTRNFALSAAASVAAVAVVGYLALQVGSEGLEGVDRFDVVRDSRAVRIQPTSPHMQEYYALHQGEAKNVVFVPAPEGAR